jgi:hypothetical protein
LIINKFFHFWAWKSNKVESLLLPQKMLPGSNPALFFTSRMFSWMLAKRRGKL